MYSHLLHSIEMEFNGKSTHKTLEAKSTWEKSASLINLWTLYLQRISLKLENLHQLPRFWGLMNACNTFWQISYKLFYSWSSASPVILTSGSISSRAVSSCFSSSAESLLRISSSSMSLYLPRSFLYGSAIVPAITEKTTAKRSRVRLDAAGWTEEEREIHSAQTLNLNPTLNTFKALRTGHHFVCNVFSGSQTLAILHY